MTSVKILFQGVFTCAILATLCLLSASCTIVEEGVESSNFDLVKLDKGVYACIHKIGGKAICNAGIVDLGDRTIIFDTFLSPLVAEEIPILVEKLGLSPIKYVINSHYHNDHVRGNQVFDEDVQIISTGKTAELIASEEPKAIAAEKNYAPQQLAYFDSLKRVFDGNTLSKEYEGILNYQPYFEAMVETSDILETRIPDMIFDGEKVITGSKKEVKLISMGMGHSESDAVLYLPEEKILFAGDLVFKNMHPFMGESDPDGWENILDNLAQLQPEIIIPGHGPVGSSEDIKTMKKYFYDTKKLVQDFIKDSLPSTELRDAVIPDPYVDWSFDNFFYSNLRFQYNRLLKPVLQDPGSGGKVF